MGAAILNVGGVNTETRYAISDRIDRLKSSQHDKPVVLHAWPIFVNEQMHASHYVLLIGSSSIKTYALYTLGINLFLMVVTRLHPYVHTSEFSSRGKLEHLLVTPINGSNTRQN